MTAPATRRPYPGLYPYQDTDEDRQLFFGRDTEKQSLLSLSLASPLALLFGRSGLGKTSLVNAGLLKPLRDKNCLPIVARVTYDITQPPVQSVICAVLDAAHNQGVTVAGGKGADTLWTFFCNARFTRGTDALRPFLVLDQFEELFSVVRPRHRSGTAEFIADLADLVRRRVPERLRARAARALEHESLSQEQRAEHLALLYDQTTPNVNILISMREDYLPELQGLRRQIPEIFRNAIRLEPLTPEEARKAIVDPGRQRDVLGSDSFDFAEGVPEEMIKFLGEQRGGARLAAEDSIEPVHLQVLCEDLNRRRMRKRDTAREVVTHADLGGRQGMQRALLGYYRRSLRTIPVVRPGWNARRFRPSLTNWVLLNRPRSAARRLCELRLITRGNRDSLRGDMISAVHGIAPHDLTALVDTRLLRVEPRLNSEFYELAHDALIRPLRELRTRTRWRWWASAAALYPVLLGGLLAIEQMRYWPERAWVRTVTDSLANPNVDMRTRVRLLTTVARRMREDDFSLPQDELEFNGVRIDGVKADSQVLRDLRLRNASFARASLVMTDLSGAELEAANFAHADLTDATFQYAHLDSAKFDGATLVRTSFESARLDGAHFSNVKLTDVDFDGASVAGVTFGERVTVSGVAWWMTPGWDSLALSTLMRIAPPDSFAITRRYRDGLDGISVGDGPAGATQLELNERAWYIATRGGRATLALRDADVALTKGTPEAATLDTKGYIFLLLGKADSATDYLRQATDSSRDNGGLAERQYHLALALAAMRDTAGARLAYLASVEGHYVPSYERALTPEPPGIFSRPAQPAPKPPGLFSKRP